MVPTSFIPAKQRHRRKRHSVAAPAPTGLTITNVAIAGFSLRVYFSGDVVWDGVTVPSNFKAVDEEGMESCVNVVGTGENFIDVEFNSSVAPGAAWELDGAMAGITPAVAFPQSGVVS